MEFKDQLQRIVNLPSTPERIVSLVPSQTELLVDLGLRDRLVGVTKFCVHPQALKKEIAVVGGTKKVHFDRINQLKPDLVICNKEENTQEIVATLSKFVPVWVSDIYTIVDVLDMINRLGMLLGVSAKAAILNKAINTEYRSFIDYMKGRPQIKTAYLIWKKPFMAAGNETFINELLRLNNFANIFESHAGRYPEVTLNDMRNASQILLSSEPYPFRNTDVIALKKALQNEVLLVDGEYFSWYGSRLIKAFAYFKTLHN